MRERISVPSVVLVMKSFAPAARARFLVASSSSPEITITGMLRMRWSWDWRMRSSSAKPSSTGIWMSENTTTMEGSVEIASQPASPFASSRTSKLLRIRRASVVRTILESSTRSTRCFGIWVDTEPPGLELISGRQIDDDASLGRALEQAVEGLRELVERDGSRHLLEVRRSHVAGEPPPHLPALRHRRGPGVDPQQAHAAQNEGRDRGVQIHARREADRSDGSTRY